MDQRENVCVKDPDQERRDSRQDDDPVRVDEPVAEVDELPREEAIACEHRTEAREALIRGVRGQDEDREREPLDRVVQERGPR